MKCGKYGFFDRVSGKFRGFGKTLKHKGNKILIGQTYNPKILIAKNFSKGRDTKMDKKILITFPCSLGELLDKAKQAVDNDRIDSCEICTCGYDGDGDAIFVAQDYKKEV